MVLNSLLDGWRQRPPAWTQKAEFSDYPACPFCDCPEVGRQWEDMSSVLYCEVGVLWRVYSQCLNCHQNWWIWQRDLVSTVEASIPSKVEPTES